MADMSQQLEERKARLAAAVALEVPDRVPVVPLGNAFAAKAAGMPLEEFAADPAAAYQVLVEVFTGLGEIDGTQQAHFSPYLLSLLWNSRVKVPGKDLPGDALWQVEELELMTAQDYDLIVEQGYGAFVEKLHREQLDEPLAKLGPYMETVPAALAEWESKGIPVMALGVVTVPFEALCGARSLRAFIMDLYRIPDKVEAALKAAMPAMVQQAVEFVRAFPDVMGVWVGGWRTASQFLAPKLWERFVWPYYRELIDTVLAEGVIPVLHFDANWNRDLARLRELPAGRCVLSTDGSTDIRKAKAVLGDHMCLMGDVPAQLLTIGTPGQVHDYCAGLIRDLGPRGFILSSGCDIPYSAKLENVRAMIAARE
jgi:hypothetical protein